MSNAFVGGQYRWVVCALLFFATTINYLDRQVLSLLAPELSLLFNWSNSDYANITAVFQLVYALAMVFAGRFVDRLGTKNGFALAVIVWSLAALLHAYAITLGAWVNAGLGWFGLGVAGAAMTGFMVARALLAVGEAANFPAAIKATAEHFPQKERALATGIFNSGANVGAILAPLSVPWLAAVWGWQTAFMVVASLGFVWVVFWWWLYQSNAEPAVADEAQTSHPQRELNASAALPWRQLLRYRQTWAFAFGKFMTDGVWWFYLFWLPSYLASEFGLQKTELMLPLAVLYSLTVVGSIGGGGLSLPWIKRGFNAYDARLKAMLAIAFVPLVVLLAQPLGHVSLWVPVLLIGLGGAAHQAWSCNIFTIVSDLFPKHSVASVVGIGGMAGGLGGVLLAQGAGRLFDHFQAAGALSSGYTVLFSFCALAYLIAWGGMKLLVPAYSPVLSQR